MKFLRRLILVVLAFWVVSIPIASNVAAGSFLYSLKIKVNDPVLAWMQITSEGRGESYLKQFGDALDQYVAAVYGQDSHSEFRAKDAINISWNRVIKHATNARKAGNHKVSDAMLAHALGSLRGNVQVLNAMSENEVVPRPVSDFEFISKLDEYVFDERQRELERFRAVYAQVELVRGTDDRLQDVEEYYKSVLSFINTNGALYQEVPKEELEARLSDSKESIAQAKNKISSDAYVDAFLLLDTGAGIAREVEVIARDMKSYGVPVFTRRSEY